MRENSPSSRWVKTSPPPWARVHSLPAFSASAWVSWVDTTLPFSSFTLHRSPDGMTWMFAMRGVSPGASRAKTQGSCGSGGRRFGQSPTQATDLSADFRTLRGRAMGDGDRSQARDAAAAAGPQGQEVAATAKSEASEVTETAKDQARQVKDEAASQARGLVDQAKNELRDQGRSQTDQGADAGCPVGD